MRKGVRIASPCSTAWDKMSGDDQVRFCPQCQLNVYNFAEMHETEVNRLLDEREGRVCAKVYQRACGTVVTKDSPVAFRILPLLPGFTDRLQPETVDLLIGKQQQIVPETRPLPQSHPGETGITLLAYDPMGLAATNTPFFIQDQKTRSRTTGTQTPAVDCDSQAFQQGLIYWIVGLPILRWLLGQSRFVRDRSL